MTDTISFQGILKTRRFAATLLDEAARRVNALSAKGICPFLHIVLVGDNPASAIYVHHKIKVAQALGIEARLLKLPEDTSPQALERTLKESCAQSHGTILQLPLPAALDKNRQYFLDLIPAEKDIDGLSTLNAGRLEEGFTDALKPATPLGVMRILSLTNTPLKGKHAVVLGRSNLVGRPVASLLALSGATVTTCHKETENVPSFARQADILISATGVQHLVTPDYIKDGAVVIDVGIIQTPEGLRGDVDTLACLNKAQWITPVPGGVGRMTIASLMTNLLDACSQQHGTIPAPWVGNGPF